LKVSEESSKHHHNIPKKQLRRINLQTIKRDKGYTVRPPRQEIGSNPITCQKEDETQQQNTGKDVDLKWKPNLDRKQAFASDKEKAFGAGINNNQAKK